MNYTNGNPILKIIETMAATCRNRDGQYGDNYKMIGRLLPILFPNGVTLRTEDDFMRFNLFEMCLVKITRYAVTGLTHKDSIHDLAVYGAMAESVLSPDAAPIRPAGVFESSNGKAKLLDACKMALGAFERNDAIDWNVLYEAIKENDNAANMGERI